MLCVNVENYTYCRYENEKFVAFISFGANPESILEDRLEYYVTVLESEDKEVFQETFETLSEACFYLNEHYGDWHFENQTATKSGCSTCAAH